MASTERNYWFGDNRLSRRRLVKAGGTAGVGLAAAALIGCGSDDDEPATPRPAATQAPGATPTQAAAADPDEDKFGGELVTLASGPQNNYNMLSNWWMAHQIDGLISYDRPISPRPDERVYVLEAAESIETPDPLTVIIKYKPGITFHDLPPVNGREFTAEDVVDYQYFIREVPEAHNRSFQVQSMDTVEATDDRTVVFHLQQPNAYLFSSAQLAYAGNLAMVPRELFEDGHESFDQTPSVGSGPWQRTSYQFGVRYEFERFPNWREAPLPYIDKRSVIALTDTSAIETAVRGEQLHLWIPPAETADRLTRDIGDKLTITEFLTFSAFTWNMSSKRAHFDDIRVREAFYRIFNPDEYIDLVANGWAEAVPGMLAASLSVYQLDWNDMLDTGVTVEQAKRHDMEEAKALLDAAGFDYNKSYELTTLTSAVNESALQVMDRQFTRAGIGNLTYNVRPAGEWLPEVSNTGNYDFCCVGHPAEDTPHRPMKLNHSDTGMIHQAFNLGDPEVDDLIDRSEVEPDFDAHVELVKAAQRKLLEKYAHMSYIYTARNRELRYNYIMDWEFNPATHAMHRDEAWLDI